MIIEFIRFLDYFDYCNFNI